MVKRNSQEKRLEILAMATGSNVGDIRIDKQRSPLQKLHAKDFAEVQKHTNLGNEYQDQRYELFIDGIREEAQRRIYGKAEELRQVRKIKKEKNNG